MTTATSGRVARFGRVALTLSSLAALVSCNEQRLPSGIVPDDIPPTASIESSVDTVDINQGLQFTVSTTDNVGLKTVNVVVTGAVVFSFDTTFTSPVLSYSKIFNITIAAGAAGGPITINLTVTDGAGNDNSASRTISVFDPVPPTQVLLLPSSGAAFGAGDTAIVVVRTSDPSGVVLVVARLFVNDVLGNPITISADTAGPFSPPQFGVTDTLSLAIPDTAIYFDIEGLRNPEFHYLIGLLRVRHGELEHQSFWADSKADEVSIFQKFAEDRRSTNSS